MDRDWIRPDAFADPEPEPCCLTTTMDWLMPDAAADPIAVPLGIVDMVIV